MIPRSLLVSRPAAVVDDVAGIRATRVDHHPLETRL